MTIIDTNITDTEYLDDSDMAYERYCDEQIQAQIDNEKSMDALDLQQQADKIY